LLDTSTDGVCHCALLELYLGELNKQLLTDQIGWRFGLVNPFWDAARLERAVWVASYQHSRFRPA